MGDVIGKGPVRDLAVDFYRVSGVVLVVLGHWLAAAVTYHDGHFGRENPLADLPWTQYLTWVFQAVPTFFLAAGYAGALSWEHRRNREGFAHHTWLRHRLARVLGPCGVYLALVSAVVVALEVSGVTGSALQYAGWALAMHLWFLAIYLVVVTMTPIAVAAHQRWGLRAPAVLALGAVAIDVAAVGCRVPYIGWLNYVLCWGTLYQLGIAWRGGLLGGRKPLLMTAVSAIALAVLVRVGPYPVSMIRVAGHTVHNTTPPTVALLAFACAQTGLAMTLAPAVRRALRSARAQRVVSVANDNVMALYLWHLVPLVIVAVVGYPAGLFPQPAEGSAAWWLFRLVWLIILSMVTAVQMTLLWWGRRVFAAPLPTVDLPWADRWAEPVLLVGAAMATYGLAYLAAEGFAPHGHFAWISVLAFAGGAVLIGFRPTRVGSPVHSTPRAG
ncbi:acyltransferase family protein [Mycobacterium spongiae]|uniref:Acyltransferase family protein n=1 Tax=Mycobacterium spongiae TaxID=886343 RepID=A0A975PX85_9MYCO|nr:acyltransferase [Mycobacterium spongiae]QUR67842.1 acyltransferase family protein [Mycobacterium spongiae]